MSLDNSQFLTMGLPMGHSTTMAMGQVPPILSVGGILPPGNAAFWELERRALETFNRKRREARIEERRKETVLNSPNGYKKGCGDDEESPYEDEPMLSCTLTKGRSRRSEFKGRRWELDIYLLNFALTLQNLVHFYSKYSWAELIKSLSAGTSFTTDRQRRKRRRRNQNVKAKMG